jgi:phosphotransferase system enzyme I (PtsP)
MSLIALGFRSISMAPASLGPVKAMIRSLDAGGAAKKLQEILAGKNGSIRAELHDYASDNGVEI